MPATISVAMSTTDRAAAMRDCDSPLHIGVRRRLADAPRTLNPSSPSFDTAVVACREALHGGDRPRLGAGRSQLCCAAAILFLEAEH